MRLNKYISGTGICSRREADALIAEGRVTLNGQPAGLGTRVALGDQVCVDDELLGEHRPPVYIALNKPAGITCTSESHVEDNIVDFIGHSERIFPIGRLDKESEGLILLTNNGDIVNPILRAESGHEKEYLVSVDRPVTWQFLEAMARGIRLRDVQVQGRGSWDSIMTKPCITERLGPLSFRIVLTQGLNRQIRRMCDSFHYQVLRLTRVRIGQIVLGELKTGHWRYLRDDEVAGLSGAGAAVRSG